MATPDPGNAAIFASSFRACTRLAISCIVKLDGARHNDMYAAGSAELKARIRQSIEIFLRPALDHGPIYACAP
ncbi:MAG: hypothetical protein V4724_01990 [Pseudomonadota bacterium]